MQYILHTERRSDIMTKNELGLKASRHLSTNGDKKLERYLVSNGIPINKKLNSTYVKKMKEESEEVSKSFLDSLKNFGGAFNV